MFWSRKVFAVLKTCPQESVKICKGWIDVCSPDFIFDHLFIPISMWLHRQNPHCKIVKCCPDTCQSTKISACKHQLIRAWLSLVKHTLCDEQLPFPADIQLCVWGLALCSRKSSLCAAAGSNQLQVEAQGAELGPSPGIRSPALDTRSGQRTETVKRQRAQNGALRDGSMLKGMCKDVCSHAITRSPYPSFSLEHSQTPPLPSFPCSHILCHSLSFSFPLSLSSLAFCSELSTGVLSEGSV